MELDQFRDVDLVIDRANDSFVQKQFVSQGDYKGRSLTVQVTNNGSVGEVPGLTLNLRWHNEANGLTDLSAFSVVDKSNSIFRIEYPQNMLTPGKVFASVQILQNGKTTQLKEFELTVQRLAGEAVGIAQKAEFSALVAALADSNKFRTDINDLNREKVDRGGVGQVSFDMLDQSVKEAMTGGSVAVVEGKSISGKDNIINDSVISENVSGSFVGHNLLDLSKIEYGKYIVGDTGVVMEGTSESGLNCITGFIPVDSGDRWYFNNWFNVTYYDSSYNYKDFLTTAGSRVFTIPSEVSNMRLSMRELEVETSVLARSRFEAAYRKPLKEFSNVIPDEEYGKIEVENVDRVYGYDSEANYINITESTTRISSKGFFKVKANTLISLNVPATKIQIVRLDASGQNVLPALLTYNPLSLKEVLIDQDCWIAYSLAFEDNRELDNYSKRVLEKGLTIKELNDFELMIYQRHSEARLKNPLLKFGLGSATSVNGTFVSADNRIISDLSFMEKGTKITITDDDKSYKLQLLLYDKNTIKYLRAPVLFADARTSFTINGDYFVRAVFAYTDDSVIDDIEKVAANVHVTKSYELSAAEEIANELILEKELTGLKDNISSLWIIEDNLLIFSASDYSESGTKGNIYVFDISLGLENMKLTKTIKHNFNHVNSIGYSEKNDCLFCTSFVGDATPTSEIKYELYVIPDVKESIKTKTEWLLTDDMKIKLPENFGKRMNATTAGKDDQLYIITNDNKDIRLIQLGKNEQNWYDGSFVELAHYKDVEPSGLNQSSIFHRGKLFFGLGHEGIYYQITSLFNDGSIKKKLVKDLQFDSIGNALYRDRGFGGLFVYNDKLICLLNASDNDSCRMFVYQM